MSTTTLNRREFMKSGTALVIGFSLPGFSRNGNWLYAQNQERPQVNPLNAWVRIAKDNSVTLILAKSEMGQGVTTSLPMILAEELDIPWSSVKVEQALTDPTVYEHGTGGSGSIAGSYLPLRQAGAAARQMLIAAAAQIWETSPDMCHVKGGAVFHGARTRKLTYGELVETAVKMPIPDLKKVALKNSNTFDLIGKSLPRLDIPGKVNGTAVFGIDVRVPDMLRAVVARCPYYGGKVKSYDAAKAKTIPGVVQVVEVAEVRGSHSKNGIAVVAQNTWAAIQGRDALVVEWEGASADESSDALSKRLLGASEQPGKAIRNEGDLDAAFASAAKKIDAIYELPFLAHATMEPMNCTADVRADSAEVWAPTQSPDWVMFMVAQATGLKRLRENHARQIF